MFSVELPGSVRLPAVHVEPPARILHLAPSSCWPGHGGVRQALEGRVPAMWISENVKLNWNLFAENRSLK
jgi:hypothetical protein